MKNFFYFILILIFFPSILFCKDTISLENFLQQVKTSNGTYTSTIGLKSSARGSQKEADLLFSPTAFASTEIKSNQKKDYGSIYDSIDTNTYDFGVSQSTRYGLETKIYYEYKDTNYKYTESDKYYDASPIIELSLPVWQNAFGKSNLANEKAIRSQGDVNEWSSENDRKNLLVNAELSYWRLAIAQELVEIQKKGVSSSQEIYDYIKKRVAMNLTDTSDLLQSNASLQSKKLDLKNAIDEQKSAMRNFNSYRNSAEEAFVENINWEKLQNIFLPDTHGTRADVKTSEAELAVSEANAVITEEKNKPSLNFYLNYALNGDDKDSLDAVSNSIAFNKKTTAVGLNFSIPINNSASKEVIKAAKEKIAAKKKDYLQKLKNQENDWKDLIENLKDAKEKLEMSFNIKNAQKEKLDYERNRLKTGRTTTYEVLSFEQDYLNAEATRVDAAYSLLKLLAQIQLYQNEK